MQDNDLVSNYISPEKLCTRYILGVKVNFGLNTLEAGNLLLKYAYLSTKPAIVCTTNPEFVMGAQQDVEFKKIINDSLLSLPDGIGIIFADKYLERARNLRGTFLGKNKVVFSISSFVMGVATSLFHAFDVGFSAQRVTGVDLASSLCALGSQSGTSFFFLGGLYQKGVGISDMAADNMKKQYRDLNIVGNSSGFSFESFDDTRTVDYINSCVKDAGLTHVDFLFVGYGHGKQEKWINRNIHNINAKVCIGVGGTLDYMSGTQKVTPNVYKRLNLDWFYRLVTQRWRISRTTTAFPRFAWSVYRDSLKYL